MNAKRPGQPSMDSPAPKKAKTGGMAAAQRMMQKMGYVEGEGLGREKTGIVEPIAVKLRPQGAGVGTIKEKTAQAKAEEKRAAERRGEEYVDSSEEERRARKLRREERKKQGGQAGVRTAAKPARQKVRTIEQIEKEDGLQVPDVFKNFIDHTGAAPKQITSTADLASSSRSMVPASESQTQKLIKNAQLELDAFVNTWQELQDRKKYCDLQELQITEELAGFSKEESAMDALAAATERLASLSMNSDDLETQINAVAKQLGNLQALSQEIENNDEVEEVAAAAIDPLLVRSLDDWSPFHDLPTILPHLKLLKPLLLHPQDEPVNGVNGDSYDHPDQQKSRQLDFYESMMFSRWLPKIRTAITNDWDPFDASTMLSLLNDWRDVLPTFLLDIVINQLVVQKLADKLKSWKPGSSRNTKTPAPHIWLFPWFEHLNDYHTNPHSASGLLAEVRRKFRSTFATWNPSKGLIQGLDNWLQVASLQKDLQKDLNLRLLPRLTQYLRDDFDVDPSDQDRTPIDVVLQWEKYFSPAKFARVFIDAFFPKWFKILRIWLTADPNYEEVGQWYEWWRSVFPEQLNKDPSIDAAFEKGLEMMAQAMELGPEQAPEHLAVPNVEPVTTEFTVAPEPKPEKETKPVEEEATMKDMLEELCEEEDVLLLPLRKAHPETGHPLLRITASASGSGGVVVYIAGDVVMAQNKRDRSLWEPLDVFAPGLLSRLAEGK